MRWARGGGGGCNPDWAFCEERNYDHMLRVKAFGMLDYSVAILAIGYFRPGFGKFILPRTSLRCPC